MALIQIIENKNMQTAKVAIHVGLACAILYFYLTKSRYMRQNSTKRL